ncbi:MAG: radical SAM family heme chaperone HemW [Alphaproteobacteria bacterium]|nr:radical SAM family heme chaperone HemW [Alphaproteobacteria bacterium]
MAFGIYIHWPFCRSKCPYCDFYSKVQKNVPQDALVKEYLEDIKYYADKIGKREVTSIFFGGGTPSLLTPSNIEKLINEVAKNWLVANDVEISLEANPNTNKDNLFRDLHNAGINRLSLGIQSLRDSDLKFLGRTHSVKEALQSVEEVLNIFDNHSADLIYARPNQSKSEWEDELTQLCKFGFKHLSLYQLTIEEGTVFAKKGIEAVGEDDAIELYKISEGVVESYGYKGYEVSNYAKSGFECRHNKIYWQGDDYVGIGKGAHGRLRIGNKFYATTHHRVFEEITGHERAEELVFMGLRLREGINKKYFEKCCGIKFDEFIDKKILRELENQNLLYVTDQSIRATDEGILLLNQIIEQLVCM